MLTLGSVLLAEWLVAADLTQIEFFDRHGMAQSTLSSYLRGVYLPRRPVARFFATVSKGKVPTAAWDEIALAGAMLRHARAMAKIRKRGHERSGDARRAAAPKVVAKRRARAA